MALAGRIETELFYDSVIDHPDPKVARKTMRDLCRRDLYFLLTVTCGRKDLCTDWHFERIREVMANPDGYVDLWHRFAGKSTIITQGLTLQEILKDPNITVAILSYNKDTAITFLRWVKREFESNTDLKQLFPEICWNDPTKESTQWSEQHGILVKRATNRKEATLEAYGLVDGQPVGRHPTLVVYDDIVIRGSTTTPEQIMKTTQAWEESLAIGGVQARRRIVGTRWHFSDTYAAILDKGTFKERVYPVADDDGNPLTFVPKEQLVLLRKNMGPSTFAAQMLLNPRAESEMGFDLKWIRYYRDHRDGAGMNIYIIVDPANSKKKDRSFSAIAVVGLGTDGNYYWLDGVRERMSLDQRLKALFSLHQTWARRINRRRQIVVGYECYGTQASDLDVIREWQDSKMYRFPVIELRGRESKFERIPLLEPDFAAGRWYWPELLMKRSVTGEEYDLVRTVRDNEFLTFPFGAENDFLDALSRIKDPALGIVWPEPQETSAADRYDLDDWGGKEVSAWAV